MDFEKNPSYLEATNFAYDTISGLDSYVTYPQSPFVGIQMGLPSQSPKLGFNTLNMANNLSDYASYPAATYVATPTRPFTPPDGQGIAPAGLYNLSGGEMSSDGLQSGRRSRGSGTHSPASSAHGVTYPASVPRSHRFNPIAAAPPATRRTTKRRNSRTDMDSDDEDEDFQPVNSASANPDSRRETIRKQRIESEQRRRDELREGYARLRETLPTSNQKASKVSLLDRATTHIRYLDTVRDQLEARLKAAEAEVHRLRSVNEALMLGTAEQRHAAAAAAVAAAQSSAPY